MSTLRSLYPNQLTWIRKIAALSAVLLLAGCIPGGEKKDDGASGGSCKEEEEIDFSHKGKNDKRWYCTNEIGETYYSDAPEYCSQYYPNCASKADLPYACVNPQFKKKKSCGTSTSTTTATTTTTTTSTSTGTTTSTFPELPNRVCTVDKFQQASGEQQLKKVDILFVMDHSGSMQDDWERVANNVKSLVRELPDSTDVRYAVLLADVGAWRGKLYAPAGWTTVMDNQKMDVNKISTNLHKIFVEGMKISDAGSGEASFHSLYHAVTTNAVANQKLGFFRADAALSVIFMSDEQEIGYPFPNPQAPGLPPRCDSSFEDGIKKDYYDKKGISLDVAFNAVKKLKGDLPVKTHAFVNITKEDLFKRNSKNAQCLYDSLGYGYMEMVAKTKGVLFSIQEDKAEGLARCGKVIKESLELQHEFPLSKTADKVDAATILANVDNSRVAHDYRAASNSVYLENAGVANSQIAIRHCEPVPGNVAWNLTGFAGTPAQFSVGLSWATNEYATSGKVLWGTSAASLTNEAAIAGRATNHAVTVAGLSPNTVYHFQAVSWDEFGQEERSAVLSFRTLPDWAITGFGGAAARTTASLQWTTAEYATGGKLFVGTDASSLSQYGATTAVGNGHSVEVSGLAPDTLYYFQAESSDGFGLVKRSDVISIRTQADWGLSGFQGAAARTVANLSWNTPDELTTGKVVYGTSAGSLGGQSASTASGLTHAVSVSGLNPATDYYFQAVATDGNGTEKRSNVILVRTADDWAITGFSGVSTQTAVSLTWATNGFNTSGKIYWGDSEAALTNVASDAANGQAHSVAVNGLNPDTLYYFQASSTDSDGLEKRSAVVAIRTQQIPLPTWTISGFAGTSTKDSVTLTWNTEQYATTGYVLWGTSLDGVTSQVNGGGAATSHAITVTGLNPDTIYYFVAVASDDRGQEKSSDVIAVRTMKDDVVIPPQNWVITGFDGTTTADQVNLIWQTPGAATTAVVKVGLTAEDLSFMTLNVSESIETHIVGVTGLNADTTYYIQVIASDSAGRTVESVVISKRTKAQ